MLRFYIQDMGTVTLPVDDPSTPDVDGQRLFWSLVLPAAGEGFPIFSHYLLAARQEPFWHHLASLQSAALLDVKLSTSAYLQLGFGFKDAEVCAVAALASAVAVRTQTLHVK